jgi:cytochrome c553
MSAGKYLLHAIAAALAAALMTSPGQAGAGDVERGKAKAVACVACHGATGVGARREIPNLAGQHEAYLAAQIRAFRRAEVDGGKPGDPAVRYDPVMGHQAAGMTNADADDLAAYYASRPCVPEKLDKGEPAAAVAKNCAECHGAFGRSTNALVPRLAGQHDDYLENQLRAFRGLMRDRPAGVAHRLRVHPVMGPRGMMLNDQDIRELAGYFSGLSCR